MVHSTPAQRVLVLATPLNQNSWPRTTTILAVRLVGHGEAGAGIDEQNRPVERHAPQVAPIGVAQLPGEFEAGVGVVEVDGVLGPCRAG